MDALEAIGQRHSTRRFLAKPVPREILEQIVDAGRCAASAKNEQPWTFVVVTEKPRLAAIAAATDYGKFIADAAACIGVLCVATPYYLEDGCAASQNLLIAATALGVQSCWVAGHGKPYAEALARQLGVPAEYKLISLVTLGYEAAAPRLPHKRDLKSVLHWETFNAG